MKKILPAFFALAILGACKKAAAPQPDNPYGLPNATQTGANIFASRMNGNNWIAPLAAYHYSPPVEYRGNYFNIYGQTSIDNFNYEIDISIYGNIRSDTTYSFADSIHTRCLVWTDHVCVTYYNSITNGTRTGAITLTKVDTVNSIISGTFWFKMPIPNCDSINVTDGRFDCLYNIW